MRIESAITGRIYSGALALALGIFKRGVNKGGWGGGWCFLDGRIGV